MPERPAEPPAVPAAEARDSLTSLLDVAPDPSAPPAEAPDLAAEQAEPPAAAVGAGSAYADILMPRAAAPHRDRLIGSTDRQAEADGVRPGRRAAVPSWDEIVFGSQPQEAGVAGAVRPGQPRPAPAQPRSAPVAAGRCGSPDHSLQEPG